MGYALPITVQMTYMQCGQCGISFSVPEVWRAEKKRDGDGWFCPNGHQRVYSETDKQRLERELKEEQERHKRTLSRMNQAEAEASEERKKSARLAKRIKAGTCPCCKRTFRQLTLHMKHKHPEYGDATQIRKSK